MAIAARRILAFLAGDRRRLLKPLRPAPGCLGVGLIDVGDFQRDVPNPVAVLGDVLNDLALPAQARM